jgi:hypothetical protein|tara:strand:- start:67 stop:177 length:111 start_codon:yes stop_codon:yes gene_type:complete
MNVDEKNIVLNTKNIKNKRIIVVIKPIIPKVNFKNM